MPLLPNILERFLIRRGTVPGVMLDLLAGVQHWALIGAMETGILDRLQEGPADAATIARELGLSERGVERLLELLGPMGYVEERDGTYQLTKGGRRWLPEQDLQGLAAFFKDTTVEFRDVDRAIRDAPEEGIYGWENVQSGEVGRSYQAQMRWLAKQTLEDVVGAIDLPDGARRMLDVGGSHGLYTVAFCRENPKLEGTVLDWEIGLENARETLEEATDVADRIDLLERDFEEEELPGGYDFVFLGNIIHGISPEGNRELFEKIGGATSDRAVVGIVDQLKGVSGSTFAKGIAALAGFNLFLFSGGRSYEYETLKEWLADAGFDEVSQSSLSQPGFSLVVGRK